MFEKALTVSIERDGGEDTVDITTALKDLGKTLESQVNGKIKIHSDSCPEFSMKGRSC